MRNFTVQPTTIKVRHLLKVLLIILTVMLSQAKTSLASTESAPTTDSLPIAIQAVNPGYTVDGQSNTNEYIELINLSLEPVSLSGIVLNYTNSSGNISLLYEFPEGSIFSGETILLRYAKSPEVISANSIVADDTYEKTLAFSGSLSLEKDGEVLSSICWSGKTGCLKNFKSQAPTTIARTLVDEETDTYDYVHQPEYETLFNPDLLGLYLPDTTEEPLPEIPSCSGLIITEILSYYDASSSEQFVELYNATQADIDLAFCSLRYKNKTYAFPEIILSPDQYYAFSPPVVLTKNPTSSNSLEIVDLGDNVVFSAVYPHGQKKFTSYAFFGFDHSGQPLWQITYAPTPSAMNVFQEYRSCPAGKVINEVTGNCVTAAVLNTTLEACPAGKYRNPATGRCKKIEENGTSECQPGYERNPDTNRCRKIKDNTPAEYSLVPVTGVEENKSFVAFWILISLAILGVIYVLCEFRHEIYYFVRKILRRKS